MAHLGDKMSGKVKENVGWAIGDKEMEARGKAQATEAETLRHGGEPSRVHGNMESAKGATKENVGQAVGDRGMQARGAAQRTTGNAEAETAKNLNYAGGAKDRVVGGAKENAGRAMGNRQMEAEGQARNTYGNVRQGMNQ
ncbi:hypothetical protein BDF19DRAFT_431814 [Syncephalis fuscata]|nr:hypothetical protein BDF19DRAFT_431814 [Syncephalis fuscata]